MTLTGKSENGHLYHAIEYRFRVIIMVVKKRCETFRKQVPFDFDVDCLRMYWLIHLICIYRPEIEWVAFVKKVFYCMWNRVFLFLILFQTDIYDSNENFWFKWANSLKFQYINIFLLRKKQLYTYSKYILYKSKFAIIFIYWKSGHFLPMIGLSGN